MSTRRTFFATGGLLPAALATPHPQPQQAPSADVFEAAYKGDTARINELAKWNPALARLRSADGRTPLHYAVDGGQVAMVPTLTLLGADLSAGPESPLLKAVAYTDPAVAFGLSQSLAMNASDPNARAADGRTAIQIAAGLGRRDIVDLLAHRGAAGPEAERSSAERVYFGKRYSFDLDGNPYVAPDIEGLPQDFINDFVRAAHGDGVKVKRLRKIVPGLVGARATWDEMAVEAAAHMGLMNLAHLLADNGAPVSTCTATLLGFSGRVEALVKADAACVRERGAHDIGLIAYTALADQRPQIADFLLRSGASVSAKALGGATALHVAARKGYVELAEVLLARGAEINGEGVTPLATAVKAKQDKMADFLKSRGGRT
jgi:ankyrin repeat protein